MNEAQSNNANENRTSTRDKISDNIDMLRERVGEAGEAGRQALEDHPGIAVAVAATVGAVVAGVIPTSRREVEALRPVAQKARQAMGKAVETAKTSGIQHLTEKGLNSAAISAGVASLVGAVLKSGNTSSAPEAPIVTPANDALPDTETA
jgi:hypothetical protein